MKPHQFYAQKQLCNCEAPLHVGAQISPCSTTLRRWAHWLLRATIAQVIFVTANLAQAQIDPSSALLLNGSARSSSRDNGVDSGRYTVRPRSDAPKPRINSDESASRARLRTVETTLSNNSQNSTGANSLSSAPNPNGAVNPALIHNSRSTKSVDSPSSTKSHFATSEAATEDSDSTPVQVVSSAASAVSTSPVAVEKGAPVVLDVSSGATSPSSPSAMPIPKAESSSNSVTNSRGVKTRDGNRSLGVSDDTKDSPQNATGDASRESTNDATNGATNDVSRDTPISRRNDPTDANRGAVGYRSEAAARDEDDAIREQVARDQGVIRKAAQNNLLDISFSAGYLYNDSSSTYSFRKYSTAAPAVTGDAHIWLSPAFGVGGSYLTTLSGSLPDGSHPSRVVPTTQQTFTLGIRYRDYFTHDLTYPYLIWGADYYQYHLSVPQDAQSRADLYSIGAKFSIMGVFPCRRSYAWNLGFALFPKMYHHEGSNAAGFRSGGHADANSVEILLGGQWQLSPSSSMFWRVTYQIEKDVFTGQASVPDPSSHTTPTGVSVTNSTVFLQMGYGWGN